MHGGTILFQSPTQKTAKPTRDFGSGFDLHRNAAIVEAARQPERREIAIGARTVVADGPVLLRIDVEQVVGPADRVIRFVRS
jgi:hypothetical protein